MDPNDFLRWYSARNEYERTTIRGLLAAVAKSMDAMRVPTEAEVLKLKRVEQVTREYFRSRAHAGDESARAVFWDLWPGGAS
jgi:hypothetical protein